MIDADTDARSRRAVLEGLSDTLSGHGGGRTGQGFGAPGYDARAGCAPAAAALLSKDGAGVAAVPPATTSVEPFVGEAHVGIRRAAYAEAGRGAALASFRAGLRSGCGDSGRVGQTGARAQDEAVRGSVTLRF